MTTLFWMSVAQKVDESEKISIPGTVSYNYILLKDFLNFIMSFWPIAEMVEETKKLRSNMSKDSKAVEILPPSERYLVLTFHWPHSIWPKKMFLNHFWLVCIAQNIFFKLLLVSFFWTSDGVGWGGILLAVAMMVQLKVICGFKIMATCNL